MLFLEKPYLLCPILIQHTPPIETGINHRYHNLSGSLLEMIDPLEFDPKWGSMRSMCLESTQLLCSLIETEIERNEYKFFTEYRFDCSNNQIKTVLT